VGPGVRRDSGKCVSPFKLKNYVGRGALVTARVMTQDPTRLRSTETGLMRAWYHCENVYPFVPQPVLDDAASVRASLPNKYCDPEIAANLFAECLDEHLLCDELGVNIVSIEHHAGINSLYGASPMILGILARQTRNVRILSLGTLITVRPDPVRVAEEYATADVISRGRLEIGFVKSGDSEMVSGDANPVGYVGRFWEAIDLIQKTLTSHDGPFSWEGKHYTHQHVNIWPPVYQRPHPPMWAATGDPQTSAELGRRGMINALVLRGPEASKRAFDAYRAARREAGLPPPGTDRFAYAALAYVGDTDEEGLRVGSKLLWFLNTSLKQSPQMSRFLPGRTPPAVAAQNYRTRPLPGGEVARRPADSLIGITAEAAIARGILVAGNPDTVYRQIMDIYDHVGGFANFIFVGRSGFLDHKEAEKGIRLMAKEVIPRLPDAVAAPAPAAQAAE
jgi:alkanesulfonate monooxygenase SsuD/methylene tetrahydromethanopterin reductase-like flavin-dependent oxidoreductase (luciferase family)